jgi:hypothetical protein
MGWPISVTGREADQLDVDVALCRPGTCAPLGSPTPLGARASHPRRVYAGKLPALPGRKVNTYAALPPSTSRG